MSTTTSTKVHHTLYKPKYQTHILNGVTDDNGNKLPTRQEAINRLFERFNSEYGWRVAQVGKQKAIADWLSGLALNIEYYNQDIIDMAIRFGSIDANANDRLKDKVLENYWSFMANIILGMEKEVTS